MSYKVDNDKDIMGDLYRSPIKVILSNIFMLHMIPNNILSNNRHLGQLVMAGWTWDGIHPLPDRQGRGQRFCQAVPLAPGAGSRGQCHCRDHARGREKDH